MSRLSLALVRRAWERGSLVPRPFEARERGDSSCVEELLIYYWIPYGQVANLSIAPIHLLIYQDLAVARERKRDFSLIDFM